MRRRKQKLQSYQKILFLIAILFAVLFAVNCGINSMIPSLDQEKSRANDTGLETKPTEKVEPKDDYKAAAVDAPMDSISSFIPQGWGILKQGDTFAIAKGDLNRDNIPDKAIIIEKEEKDLSNGAPQRNLMIVFGNANNEYALSITAENAVLRADEGGTFGDTFVSIAMDRGSVVLKFMGGSDRWGKWFRFRYQEDGWYLIGFTKNNYELVGNSIERLQNDYNLITGDCIEETLEGSKVVTVKENREKKPLLALNDFSVSEYWMPY